MLSHERSKALFDEALKQTPGGVNSPVRAFRAVGGTPFFALRARGARVWDVDDNEYIDYVGTWGPAILGHAPPRVIQSVQRTAEMGTSFGIPNPLEVKLANLIVSAIPSVEKVRMCNSGTEACMSAIRVARGFTGRDKIIKFAGCYHGHSDSLLVKAGSGALTFGYPDSAGVPAAFTQHTLVAGFNDEEAVRRLFEANRGQVAGVILEPVPANAGLYVPRPGFLEFLREACTAEGALLIFDEVMTGFRVAYGGAQQRFGIRPDMTCLGKIIGGGLPVGAFGGRADVMDCLAPLGPVYQAGTLSGNPLAMAAGIATLEELQAPGAYDKLEEIGARLEAGLAAGARAAGIPVTLRRIGSMFCAYFTDQPVQHLEDALRSDRARFAKFFHAMLAGGVYLAPSQFEAGFISLAHTADDVDHTIDRAARAFKTLCES